MRTPQQYRGHLISQSSHTVHTDQRGPITITRWRVSASTDGSTDSQDILRDNFKSLVQARAFVDERCQNEQA